MKTRYALMVVVMFSPSIQADPPIAQQGYDFLKTYCYRCHGVAFKVPGYNVLDRDVLTAKRRGQDTPYLTPGKLDQSEMWRRVAVDGDMPPSGAKPSEAEKETFKKWIEAGAPFPGLFNDGNKRPFLTEKDILSAIRDHLNKTDKSVRKFQRYFTLTHLHNNNQNVTADQMRLYRAALSKLAHSLSWKRDIVIPKPIDKDETIYNVDLRDLGWDEHDLWRQLLKTYPYGLKHSTSTNDDLRMIAQDVYDLAGSDLPYLRADWFITAAAQPPLYHAMLRLPQTARDLEQQLRVDVEQDFLRDKLARGGVLTSGVSSQNRIVDRHRADHGAYWKSYDFKTNETEGNVVKFPLGPAFRANPFSHQAFRHAGGEIIFNLPNGLQGYLLVDEKGQRIERGPVEIVKDSQETSGTPIIVNGLSCMACHKHGIIRFEDVIGKGSAVADDALIKVRRLFPSKNDMDKLLDQDERRFLQSLEETTGSFLKAGPDKDRNIRDFPEPVGAIARLYLKDLDLRSVAMELGLDDPEKLRASIKDNRRLREVGLGPLLQGGSIKRENWDSLRAFISLYHDVARELELGTPFRVQ